MPTLNIKLRKLENIEKMVDIRRELQLKGSSHYWEDVIEELVARSKKDQPGDKVAG